MAASTAPPAPTFNIADLFELVAAAVPEREALTCGGVRRTFASLNERATRLADALAAQHGLGVGDHVGLCLHDSIEHVEAALACYKLRAVPVNVNYRYVAAELAMVFADAGVVGVVCDAVTSPEVRAAAATSPTWVVSTGDEFDALVSSGSPSRSFGPRSADDHYILYTGGTTGLPRGVVWRQEDIFFAALGAGNPGGPPIERPSEIAERVQTNRAQRVAPFLPPGDPGPEEFVAMSMGPLAHASGQWLTFGTLLGGGRVVLNHERHYDPVTVLDLVARERIVMLSLVGDAGARPLVDALEGEGNAGRWDTSSLRLLGSGGSILSADTRRRLLAALPSVLAITEAVGSSEAPVQAIATVARGEPVLPTLAFRSRPGITLVVDDDLRPVVPGSGDVGWLAAGGRVPLRYHNDPERSARTFVTIDGARYSLPGDRAVVDADGTIRLLGRGSLCINTGGEKVYPEEVEAALKSHPSIADAVVVGVPDDRWGHRVAAVVAVVDGVDGGAPTLDELQAHCRGSLAGYKVPRSLTVVDTVRRSPAGKADYKWAADVVAQSAV